MIGSMDGSKLDIWHRVADAANEERANIDIMYPEHKLRRGRWWIDEHGRKVAVITARLKGTQCVLVEMTDADDPDIPF